MLTVFLQMQEMKSRECRRRQLTFRIWSMSCFSRYDLVTTRPSKSTSALKRTLLSPMSVAFTSWMALLRNTQGQKNVQHSEFRLKKDAFNLGRQVDAWDFNWEIMPLHLKSYQINYRTNQQPLRDYSQVWCLKHRLVRWPHSGVVLQELRQLLDPLGLDGASQQGLSVGVDEEGGDSAQQCANA